MNHLFNRGHTKQQKIAEQSKMMIGELSEAEKIKFFVEDLETNLNLFSVPDAFFPGTKRCSAIRIRGTTFGFHDQSPESYAEMEALFCTLREMAEEFFEVRAQASKKGHIPPTFVNSLVTAVANKGSDKISIDDNPPIVMDEKLPLLLEHNAADIWENSVFSGAEIGQKEFIPK